SVNWGRDFQYAGSLWRKSLFLYTADQYCVYPAAVHTVSVHSSLASLASLVSFADSGYKRAMQWHACFPQCCSLFISMPAGSSSFFKDEDTHFFLPCLQSIHMPSCYLLFWRSRGKTSRA